MQSYFTAQQGVPYICTTTEMTMTNHLEYLKGPVCSI